MHMCNFMQSDPGHYQFNLGCIGTSGWGEKRKQIEEKVVKFVTFFTVIIDYDPHLLIVHLLKNSDLSLSTVYNK